jgi:hypothetical protein
MGGGYYSGDVGSRQRSSVTENFRYQGYTDERKPKRPEERQVHPDLNVSGKERVCDDPMDLSIGDIKHTTPIVGAMDLTRSRGDDANVIFGKIPMFIGQIYLNNYVPYPSVCWAGYGNAKVDLASIQITQFENDNRMDDQLKLMWLEKGGGGTGMESAELLAYFYARHCHLACNDRGKKGIFYFTTDAGFHPYVSKTEVKRIFGDDISQDIESAKIFAELQKKFDVYVIFPQLSWKDRKADIDEEIKLRVQRAGGMYEGVDIRASLIWNNRNDLDLHVITPSGFHIFYGEKRAPCGGELDVDRNVNGETIKPIENTRWAKGKARKGHYRIFVQNYRFHDSPKEETPYRVEVEVNGQVQHFEGIMPAQQTGSRSDQPVYEFDFDPSVRESQPQEDKYAGFDDKTIRKQWTGVIPSENFLEIGDPKGIVDVMLGVLAIGQGHHSLDSYIADMKNRDQTDERCAQTRHALSPLALINSQENVVDANQLPLVKSGGKSGTSRTKRL